MKQRINIFKAEPKGIKLLTDLSNYVNELPLSHTEKELIKIRASQINGCAFCISMHTKDARKYGETEQRIYLLNAWRETTFYTEREQSILALTEEITLISKNGLSDETYEKAAELFSEVELAQIIMSINVINVWNRIAIPTRMHPDAN